MTIRTGPERITNMGDKIDLLITLNQDTMDRHLGLLGPGAAVIYNGDAIKPGTVPEGVRLCPLPVSELSRNSRNKVEQNTLAVAAAINMIGIGFQPLEEVLTQQFKRKGDAIVSENVEVARAAYQHATVHFKPFERPLPVGDHPKAVLTGNMALAMGGAAAGVKFYCAYPMSPSTGVLHWMATHARQAGIMVRQVEDEIGVINMAIGAAHAGCRAMCATSGGGFALMTEGLGMSAMIETPVVVIDVQRAGPSTGVPTKTEQGVLTDLLLSEGTEALDPEELDFNVEIDRGELINSGEENGANGYKRYLFTESGISPRAIPGVPGHTHTVATDEHMEDGVLISDEFTNPIKRRKMMEKRQRKSAGIEAAVKPPELMGEPDADVTLIGWGSTKGVIEEAVEMLNDEGITANQLQIRWIVPLHGERIVEILKNAKHAIIVENNYSGQFARYLRSETSFVADGHIRKYDGEPFMPHHIVEAVKDQLAGRTKLSVPVHEIMV